MSDPGEVSPPPSPAIFTLRRQSDTPLSTIGTLDDGGWGGQGAIWILEPGAHAAPHARMPAGDYKLELRASGGKWAQFREVPALHDLILPGLPHLLPWPGQPDRLALIHPGNTYHDTEACALPGLTRWTPEMTADGQWAVGNSREAFVRIYPALRDAIQSPGGATWRILDIPPKGLAPHV